jgi:hypothetical protein
MKPQTFANHVRIVPGFHIFLTAIILASFVGSVVNLALTAERGDSLYDASLISLTLFALAMLFYYARAFALRAQDRAIRAEEQFRHYILTGKPLDGRLAMPQIIALRFASDAEFPALAERAVREGLSNRAIKQAVTQWRADHHRA